MLTLNELHAPKARILSINGKIDAKTMGEFETALRSILDGGHNNLVLDFSEVAFISSAGFGILMSVIEEIRDFGGDLVLARVQPEVFRIFDMLDFTTLFRFFDTVEAAAESFGNPS
ncbi:MAG: STAS domain-containing protein [Candidatus Sericytochromatia bacterium]|nr:STAS domain-containing protein [Candidatus Sericytochromatia bacterium]